MSTTRLRRTAAVVALAVLALTGCSNQAGAASVVGDQVVTDADVASVVEQTQAQLAAVPGTTFDEKVATTAALTMQTRHLILDAVARQEGITVTQGQVDAFIKNIVDTQFGGKAQALYDNLVSQGNVPAGQVPAAARDQIIYNALMAKIASGVTDTTAQSAAFTKYMTPFVAQLGVEVAPRYGTWNVFALGPVPDDLSFVPAAPASGGRPQPLPNPVN
ncbi:MAG: SurA N-terminal domain-containing protein [Actinomycetales bacterium]|nr:SurA N-terminal domain-containing protein [Actinomycetales bacterium]